VTKGTTRTISRRRKLAPPLDVSVSAHVRENDPVSVRVAAQGMAEGRSIAAGSKGVVVSADPEIDSYTIEILDDAGETIDLVEVRRIDLEPL